MVMQCEPIDRCITALKAERDYDDVIYVSPDGETFNQKIANEMSLGGNLIILCGHYKGIDQRVRDHLITREISVGDYVLTGGELAAFFLLLSTPVLQTTRVGRFLKSCLAAMKQKSASGNLTRQWNEPSD